MHDTKRQIKVLNMTDEIEFERVVNGYLLEGWEVLSTSCGFINSENYDFFFFFQSILINR